MLLIRCPPHFLATNTKYDMKQKELFENAICALASIVVAFAVYYSIL